ncbi:glycosyltransferase family 2 protein [Sabulicella rubraurantiaca]|uniref:glycosyltransferase family 2 protein n=1 Tax=Sabulicella rubraurantiaca TaxID=2811429 RepID=UPI001A95AE8D|nr:glycosyltransferase family 2 protein [Sabulicella rubraurantiaca]
MKDAPLLSYIVLSYNYEGYIGQTLESIRAQTVQDFEVVVVDDCSSDRSCEVIEAFRDDRIRLLRNPRNIGGAASYNRAVEAARGEWLVNLDADDWILPSKAEVQLKLVSQQPALDVVGTWVSFVDRNGLPHEDSDKLEAETNRDWDFNAVSTWIGRNALCRSSTMVRRSAHLRFGLDDENMVRAPDYELWTRALRDGCRFALLPERLTCYRLHARGVTHGNRLQSFLEMAWAARRNLLPAIERRAVWTELHGILAWLTSHAELANLSARERERLFGLMVVPQSVADYAAFSELLGASAPELEAVGRRLMAFAFVQAEVRTLDFHASGIYRDKLEADIRAYQEARDYWKSQSDRHEAEMRALLDRCAALESNLQAQPEAEQQDRAEVDQCSRENLSLRHPRRLLRQSLAGFSRFFRSS